MPDLPFIQGGAAALLGAVLWLIFSGRLVPRSTLDLVRATQEIRLAEAKHEAEEWRTAARVSAEQVGALLDGQKTVIHLLESLDKERP